MEEMDAMEIAAEVERETNLHLANMVFSCLEVLQEKGTLAGDKVEERFCSDVLEEVKKLEELIREEATGREKRKEQKTRGPEERWGRRGVY